MEEILDGKWLRSGLVYLAMITWTRLRLSMLYLGGVIRFISSRLAWLGLSWVEGWSYEPDTRSTSNNGNGVRSLTSGGKYLHYA
jgi:hypothetical protein